jgi:hypothetical protein
VGESALEGCGALDATASELELERPLGDATTGLRRPVTAANGGCEELLRDANENAIATNISDVTASTASPV